MKGGENTIGDQESTLETLSNINSENSQEPDPDEQYINEVSDIIAHQTGDWWEW